MTVKDLYDAFNKKESWSISIYFDSNISKNNIIAFCNSYYKVDEKHNSTLSGYLYSVSDLFECEVVSFSCNASNSLYIEIKAFKGMKYYKNVLDENISIY